MRLGAVQQTQSTGGLADRVWFDQQRRLMSRATTLSVIAWVIGMGFRFWFAWYACHGGGPAVARFSVQHDLSGANIWTTALVAMAFGQVLARLAVLQIRRARTARPLTVPSHRHIGTGRHRSLIGSRAGL